MALSRGSLLSIIFSNASGVGVVRLFLHTVFKHIPRLARSSQCVVVNTFDGIMFHKFWVREVDGSMISALKILGGIY